MPSHAYGAPTRTSAHLMANAACGLAAVRTAMAHSCLILMPSGTVPSRTSFGQPLLPTTVCGAATAMSFFSSFWSCLSFFFVLRIVLATVSTRSRSSLGLDHDRRGSRLGHHGRGLREVEVDRLGARRRAQVDDRVDGAQHVVGLAAEDPEDDVDVGRARDVHVLDRDVELVGGVGQVEVGQVAGAQRHREVAVGGRQHLTGSRRGPRRGSAPSACRARPASTAGCRCRRSRDRRAGRRRCTGGARCPSRARSRRPASRRGGCRRRPAADRPGCRRRPIASARPVTLRPGLAATAVLLGGCRGVVVRGDRAGGTADRPEEGSRQRGGEGERHEPTPPRPSGRGPW